MAKVRPIPEGMHSVTPQLTLKGCSEAIEFYKKAFGAVEISRAIDPSGTKVWHAALRIGDSMIFCNDDFPEMGAGHVTEIDAAGREVPTYFRKLARGRDRAHDRVEHEPFRRLARGGELDLRFLGQDRGIGDGD